MFCLLLPVWEYRKATAHLSGGCQAVFGWNGEKRLFPTKSRVDFCSVDEKVCCVFIKDLVSQWLGIKDRPFLEIQMLPIQWSKTSDLQSGLYCLLPDFPTDWPFSFRAFRSVQDSSWCTFKKMQWVLFVVCLFWFGGFILFCFVLL